MKWRASLNWCVRNVLEEATAGDHTKQEATARSACAVASCLPLWYAVQAGGTIKSPLLYQLSYAPGCMKHLPLEQLRQARYRRRLGL